MPVGEYFNVITNGKGRMMGYAPQIKVPDRWAIVAYIRALMRSQNARYGDVPEAKRGELKSMSHARPLAEPVSLPPARGLCSWSRSLALAIAAGVVSAVALGGRPAPLALLLSDRPGVRDQHRHRQRWPG